MKKTILATIIAATTVTSFGAFASKGKPELGEQATKEQQVAFAQHAITTAGLDFEVKTAANGDIVLVNTNSGVPIQDEAAIKQILADANQINRNDRSDDRIAERRTDRQALDNDGNRTGMTDIGKHIVNNNATGIDADIRRDERLSERGTERRVGRHDNGLNDNEKAIASYVLQNNRNILESENLELMVQYRKNNEDKVEFSPEQKVAAVNQIIGDDRFEVHTAADGSKHLKDSGTGQVYTADQTADLVASARSQVQQEAAKRAEENAPIDLPPVNDPIKNPVIEPDNEKVAEAVKNLIDSGEELANSGKVAKAQSQAQAAQQQAQIDEIYAQGQTNANNIETLFGEVDRLDTRIDQTQALNAATVNARPMVVDGQTAFGAGVGYAGSEAALAIGVAHSFEESAWSVSGTVAATSDDVVLGAGTQYTF
ncbi:YadA C-terminal domain-containing protein [Vibrio coralliirubri]|uniref:YadA C-terminal domain-containing protein n=1 Tax=Vibrio coralliirubri TaxID=1516159 RepID=UPI00062FE8A4|nr:YadA C-terminal domain-containing protein [Vibrio coralliirubri]CDT65540.1 conserved exported hypothetical protein [Vibrio coralliirubri]